MSLDNPVKPSWGAPAVIGRGQLVRCRQFPWGIAKCVRLETRLVVIQYWQAHDTAIEVSVPRFDLEWVEIPVGTRCFLFKAPHTWLAARVVTRLSEPRRYLVESPLYGLVSVDERELYVRCVGSEGRAEDLAALAGFDSAAIAEDRWAFIRAAIEQRANCRGLSALLSSSVEMYPHQIEGARRVLESGVQRFLLGDEVGLGKTIEAGLVLRQFLIDERDGQALVIVPMSLKDQWRREMLEKFRTGYFAGRIEIISPEDLERAGYYGNYGLVIVDEAHQIVHGAFTQEGRSTARYQAIARLAHRAPRVLLLSATPVSAEPLDLLAMLHLLEPDRYRVERPEPFFERLKWRGEIGRALLSLRPDAPPQDLPKAIEALVRMFPQDRALGKWLDELQALITGETSDVAGRDRSTLLTVIRNHVASHHRLHHRLLRNRRQAIDTAAQTGHGELPGRFGFEPVRDEHGRHQSINAALEAWRQAALKSTESISEPERRSERRRALREIFRYMVAAASSSPIVLSDLAAARRDALEPKGFTSDWPPDVREAIVGAVPFKGEPLLLDALQDACDDQSSQYAILDDMLSPHLSAAIKPKIVIFSSFTRVARAIGSHLSERLGAATVATHLASQMRQEQDRGIHRFRTDPTCQILVADASAEDGRNLQFATLILHFDLPWHPNRLEQRIGRLDRIGRRGYVGNLLSVGARADNGHVAAWLRMLDEGFRIFTRSIACLQLYTERKLRKLDDVRFRVGAEGLVAHVDVVRDEIVAEWEALDLQAAVDEGDLLDPAALSFFESLVAADRHAQRLIDAIDGWAVRQLGAARHAVVGAPNVFKYEPPTRWLGTMGAAGVLKPALMQPLAGERAAVRRFVDVELLRVGSAAFDAFWSSLAEDDRGTAYLRRYRLQGGQELPPHGRHAHVCHVVVEADREIIRRAGEVAKLGTGAIATAIRLADALLPPWTEVVYLEEELQLLSDSVRDTLFCDPVVDEARSAIDDSFRETVEAAQNAAGYGIGDSALAQAARKHVQDTSRWLDSVTNAGQRASELPADIPWREALKAAVAAPAIRIEVYGLLTADTGGVDSMGDVHSEWPNSAKMKVGVAWSPQTTGSEERPKRPPTLNVPRLLARCARLVPSSLPELPSPGVPSPKLKAVVNPTRGLELKARRRETGVSQAVLERAAGLRSTSISMFETGKREPTDAEWAALNAACLLLSNGRN